MGEEKDLAVAAIAVASIAILGLLVTPLLIRMAARRDLTTASATFRLPVPAAEALRRGELAVERVGGQSIEIDEVMHSLTAEVGASMRSFGERVSIQVYPDGEGSRVEVLSRLQSPSLVDYGKNKTNVDAIVSAMSS
jgi:hypothetical protein